ERLSSLRIDGLHAFSYRYGNPGAAGARILGIDDHGRPLARFRYDRSGRLDFALTPLGLFGYRWDAVGNLQRAVINGRATDADIDAASNRLRRISSTDAGPLRRASLQRLLPPWPGGALADDTTIHDGAGRLRRHQGLSWHRDAAGQAVEVRRGTQLLARYRHDARGRRIEKQRFDVNPARAQVTRF